MSRLQRFIEELTAVIERPGITEPVLLDEAETLLRGLIAQDDWLAPEHRAADPQRYRQNLLHLDPQSRFCVASFVWGPGQTTPIHDHTVWGLVGVMDGEELCEEFERDDGSPRLRACNAHRLPRGEVDRVSPRIGDIHRVSNALADRVTVSVHVYGGDIGRIARHTYDEQTGAVRPFVSGYSNLAG